MVYLLFLLLIAKGVQYPVILTAFNNTHSPRRRRQMVIAFVAAAVSDVIMLGYILYDTVMFNPHQ